MFNGIVIQSKAKNLENIHMDAYEILRFALNDKGCISFYSCVKSTAK